MNRIYGFWNKLPVRSKWRMLFTGIGLVCVLSYYLNIKKTISIMQEYNALAVYRDSISTLTDLRLSDEIVVNNNTQANDESALNKISSFCEENNISIREISQSSFKDSGKYTIGTNKLILSGSFSDILNLAYNVEEKKKIATISSIGMEMKKDNAADTHLLFTTLYIKHIKYEN